MDSRPLILAHRGASAAEPENTVAAFARARELGADGVELDVRRTADGVLVVHHDPERTGVGLLARHPFAVVRAAAPDVATLDEALDVLGGMTVNLEIKCLPWEPDHDDDHELVDAVVQVVRDREIRETVVVSSFDLETVNAVRAADPRVPTGWLVMGPSLDDPLTVVADLGHPWLHPHVDAIVAPEVLEATVAAAHEAGIRLDTWTVDDPEQVRTLAAAGVDALITNRPDVARAALAGADRAR